MNIKIIIGGNIKRLRQASKMTQEQLGSLCGVTKFTISLYESGKSTPSDDIKLKLVKLFEISMDELYGIKDKPVITDSIKRRIIIEYLVNSIKNIK